MKIQNNFLGGNIRLVRVDGTDVYLENELRDTVGNWFYWAFCVEGAEGTTLTFHFDTMRLGYFGPAVSHDLRAWHWLGACQGNSFTYTFGEGETRVYFAHSMLYHPDRFHALAQRLKLKEEPLCLSQKGRSVPFVCFGEGKVSVVLTSRHHACESTGSFVLEGVLEELTQSQEATKALRVFCVPFIDYDGVVDGDQGKGRAPYDHNRDYRPDQPSIYPTTAAVREYILQNGCHMGFDFHSPWHWGDRNDTVFIVQKGLENVPKLTDFATRLKAEITSDAFAYDPQNDMPYLQDWNQPSPTFAAFCSERPENVLAFTLETAYFGTQENQVSESRLVALGRCFARALLSYLRAHPIV